jgi:hypothetical protein
MMSRNSQVQFPNEKLGDHVWAMWWIVHVLANRAGVIPNKILGEIVRAEIARGEGEATS